MENKPRIRQIEAIPVDTPEGRIIILRDPFGFSPAMLQVSQEAFFVMTLMDGKTGLTEMQLQFLNQFGQMINPEHIEELVVQLDSCHFLDNDNFADLKERTIREFLDAPTRPATHAGEAYPAEEKALRDELDRLFSDNGGFQAVGEVENTARGLIAPHIDLKRGEAVYASAYRELAGRSSASTYVILGTSHIGMDNPFCVTAKDFETPLGNVKTDSELAEELKKACPWLAEEEFVHRNEHSVEFQAVFLQYLFGGKRDFTILPVLCGPYRTRDGRRRKPENYPRALEFIEALSKAVGKRPGEICIIAGADLAHVGQQFDDPEPVNETQLKYIEELDRESLQKAVECDADGFYEHVTSDGDRRRVCGLPNIYTMLRVLEGGKGRLIEYGQAPDEKSGSVVTFAGLIVE